VLARVGLAAFAVDSSERLSSTNVTYSRGEHSDPALLWLTQLEDKEQRRERDRAIAQSAELTDLIMADLG
jgi:hypothetical protein